MADAIVPATVIDDARAYDLNGERFFWQVFNKEKVNGNVNVESTIGAPGLATKTMNGMVISRFKLFGIWWQLAGAAPQVSLNSLQSKDDVLANYVSALIPGSGAGDTTARALAVQLLALPYLRIQAAGGPTNGADTTISLVLWGQS